MREKAACSGTGMLGTEDYTTPYNAKRQWRPFHRHRDRPQQGSTPYAVMLCCVLCLAPRLT